jgi:HEAT repeat protein
MNIYPSLTISLLDRLTNRELQSNYLNHLNRTSEVASLLKQITDPDLALRIVNLALEVDLNLGASLTSSLAPELQKIVVDEIDRLEIPTRLKIDLWSITKSKAALPYLQDIFIFKHRQPNDWHGYYAIESAIAVITEIDRDLAISLLIEALYDARFYSKAVEFLTELAPVEAIDGLAGLLSSPDLHNNDIRYHTIAALIKIGTEEAIAKIRDALHVYKLQWSYTDWTQGLGIVAEPAMVEHLIYLLYEPAAYTEHSANNYEAYEVDRLCREAITALERIGGERVFDWLHQAMYWIDATDEFSSPFATIVKVLFNLDSERTLTAIECAIHSYDPVVRKRAAMALIVWEVPSSDRNLSILLNALDDPDLDVQATIVAYIIKIINFSAPDYNLFNITPELRNRAIDQLSTIEAYQLQITGQNKEPDDLITLLKLLEDPDIEIRQSAVVSIIRLGSIEIFSILLKLASNSELVATLIGELKGHDELEASGKIFNEFRRDREVTTKFLETTEQSLIEAIANDIGNLCPNIFSLGEIGSDRAITTFQKIIKSHNYPCYDEPEDALRSLATIGTYAAKMALVEVFTDRPELDDSVFGIFSGDGKLGIVPQLWSIHRQTYVVGALDAISRIQEKEGLYNPEFSDRSHPLFEPPRRRLRDILLGNTTSEI